ncbi:MAG: MFS transporter [Rhodospirillaceae bacterium]|nr:MFS transporter [Rhodospirillaceae bacterium]
MNLLLLAIFAMLVQQTVATTAKVGLPALFPAVAADLSFNVELVLAYTWFFALVSLVFMAGCGGIIRRYGALRTSQFGCISMALGLLIAVLTNQTLFIIPSFALIILLISAGTTVATPASSQILAEYAPRKWAPLVFSIKQTGVPAGVAISGLVLVPLAVGYGWRMTLIYTALICVIIAIVLQPLREEFDKKRDPTEIPRWSDFISNIKDVLSQGQRREMAIAAFSFVGMQSVYTNFTITYLYEDLGFSLEEAGEILGFATLLAIPARILWGWVGSTIFQPRVLLAFLALVMAVSTALMGAFDDQWGHVAVLIVNCAISLSVLSWHGVLLSEAARLAPAGEAGRLTGGVLAFGALGQIIFPMIFAAGYWLSGYGLAFTVISLPAAMVGVIFLLWRR